MKAADLFERIDIYELKITDSPFGDTKRQWKKKYSTRARVNYSSGNRTIENDEIFFMVDREFIMRHYVPIVDTDIIVWKDEKWRVLTIDHNRQYKDIIVRTTKIMDEDVELSDSEPTPEPTPDPSNPNNDDISDGNS